MSQDVIELNGKRYDALTGAFLGKSANKPVQAVHHVHGRAVDGFVRPAHRTHTARTVPSKSTPPKIAPKPVAKVLPITPLKPKRARQGGAQLSAHKPEHAKTLMRHVVRKPKPALKPAIKVQTRAEVMAKPNAALVRKHSAQQINSLRQTRAEHTPKHQAVARFHASHHTPSVRPPAPRHTSSSRTPHIAVQAAPVRAQTPVKKPHTDMFEAAIAHATSHEQPHHKPAKKHRRLVNTLAIIGTFLVLGGFIGYLNMPGIELKIASMQAGFTASMPGYTPTGYARESGPKRNGGTISLSFRSGDSRYTVTQQASDWNSQTLLDNTLALSGPHKVVQKNGQTIYVYGNGANAAWVNGGVRYDLSGNAQLSSDEIANIATSM